MKLGKLLVVASLLVGSATYAQGECERFQGVANNAYAAGNFQEAIEYYKKAEAECTDLGKDNYDRLIASYLEMMDKAEPDSEEATDYLNKVIASYELLQEKGIYDQGEDVSVGYYYTQVPNYEKADLHLRRGIRAEGTELFDENYITLFYFNTYTMWYIEQDEAKKGELKQLLIKDYFEMSKLIKDANFAPSIQEGLTHYLGQVITSCEDLTPEIPVFIESLPEEADSKKTALLNMADLMEAQGCEDTDEYKQLIKMMYELDPADKSVQVKYVKTLPLGQRISVYRDILSNTEDSGEQNEIKYNIAWTQAKLGQHKAAYNTAKGIGGEFKGRALQIMANAVAATANSCGVSTFDRKCNYLYASQLMEQARANGASVGGAIEKYKAAGPTSSECFDNGNPSSVTLECWGVTVKPCN